MYLYAALIPIEREKISLGTVDRTFVLAVLARPDPPLVTI